MSSVALMGVLSAVAGAIFVLKGMAIKTRRWPHEGDAIIYVLALLSNDYIPSAYR